MEDKNGEQIITSVDSKEEHKNGMPLILLGFGDSDSHYKCPNCGAVYDGWTLFHIFRDSGRKTFHCDKCGVLLTLPD